MKEQIKVFVYDEQEIKFDLSGANVMVNATQMAKVFGREIKDFMRNDSTQTFIAECLKTENSPFFGIKTEADLYVSRQRSGTWMHRVLALKFAAWLDPRFELWVYATIDQLLFGPQRARLEQLQTQATEEAKIKELEADLKASDAYQQLTAARKRKQQAKKTLAKLDRSTIGQMGLFVTPEDHALKVQNTIASQRTYTLPDTNESAN